MSLLRRILDINLWTLIVNFKYFSFSQAIRFPVLIFGKVTVHALKGNIQVKGSIKTGIIRIGESNVKIFPNNTRSVLNIHGSLVCNGMTRLGKGTSISIAKGSKIELGNNFGITSNSSIIASGQKNISFGDNCLLSWDILVMNTDFHKIYHQQNKSRLNDVEDIVIGNNVWIGCKSTVLKGASIADNCVIAAGSIVTGSLSYENAIYGGIPAKKIKEDVYWEK